MLVNGKNYEVIKVYPNKANPLKDLILCENEFGYKECFHRINIEKGTFNVKKWAIWTEEEKNKIRELLRQGKTPYEISKSACISGRTEASVCTVASNLQKEMNK